MKLHFFVFAAVMLAILVPSSALAASTPTDVTGTVASELAVTATPPAAMTLSHSANGSASSTVTVSSTLTSWNLTVRDAGVLTPGQMDRVDCTTRIPTTGSLANALTSTAPTPGTSGSFSGSAATVRAGGTGVEAIAVNFGQSLGATESVTAGDCYQLTVTWTAT